MNKLVPLEKEVKNASADQIMVKKTLLVYLHVLGFMKLKIRQLLLLLLLSIQRLPIKFSITQFGFLMRIMVLCATYYLC